MQRTIEEADIVIAACGVPGLIKARWLKQDCICIDVGINYVQQEGQSVITGDFELCELTLQRCQWITPVPGGVGPMTVTMLMSNLIESWELSNNKTEGPVTEGAQELP